MDNLTHAALGLCAGLAVRRAGVPVVAAAVTALLAAELPDADLLIRSSEDPLVAFRWHRHFTHSIVLWPVLAAIAAGAGAWLFRRRPGARFAALLPPALAAGLSHVLNDACTSYGTMLLWPFSEARLAWDCLPIIDFSLTVPLVGLGFLAWYRGARVFAVAGAAWCVFYAGLGGFQHARAEAALVAELGWRPARLAVKPTVSNLVLWRGVWEQDGVWHVAAVRAAPFGGASVTRGESLPVWTEDHALTPPPGTDARRLLDDFSRFTGGWNSIQPAEGGGVLIGDIRFSMLPTRADPLWAVHLEPGNPAHFEVRMDRRIRDGDWHRFSALLLGLPSGS